MAKINQTITQFPTAPDSATDSAPVFNTKANAFVGHQAGVYVGEVNTWATEANALRDEVNGIVATIPVGTISDNTTALDSVWSSQKLVDDNFGIENGETANGKWVKYPDGTLIQYGVVNMPTYNSGGFLMNLPITFKDTAYSITVTNNGITTSGAVVVIGEAKVESATLIKLKFVTTNSAGVGGGVYKFFYQTIGRWR